MAISFSIFFKNKYSKVKYLPHMDFHFVNSARSFLFELRAREQKNIQPAGIIAWMCVYIFFFSVCDSI